MKKSFSGIRNRVIQPPLTLTLPSSVAQRLEEKRRPTPVIRVGRDEIVSITNWLDYKAELAAQGLKVVYAGWPLGESRPVWNVVKE